MDWTSTKTLAEANLDAIAAKASNPKAALSALLQKITAEVDKVEGQLTALDGRVTELPGLLDAADQMVLKVDHVVEKAKAEGKADLVAAAGQRKDKTLADRAALQAELDGIDGQQDEANDWLSKLQDKLVEVQTRIDALPDLGPSSPSSTGTPATPSSTGTPAKAPPPALGATSPSSSPPPSKPSAKAGSLDDEFAALMKDMNVDLAKVELPKKPNAPAAAAASDDDGIPDLVSVPDNELPDDEDLPPLKGQKAAPPAAKPVATAVGKVAAATAKPGVPAVRSNAPPATTDGAKKPARAWLWITSSVVVVGGAGAVLAHFVLHLF